MTYANDIKAQLISWLLPQLGEDEVISTEMPFLGTSFKADIVLASSTRLHAFEIKGPKDNLGRLDEQLEAYSRMFLAVTVVVTNRHIDSVRHKIQDQVGLLKIAGATVSEVRKATARKRLEKHAAAEWLRVPELKKALAAVGASTSNRATILELREACVKNLSAEELSMKALHSVVSRSQLRFRRFVEELGRTVTLDDVRTLSLGKTIS